jgi:hypothetical protein
MVIIITPKKGWFRQLQVIECEPDEEFTNFQRINEIFDQHRDALDITLQHITLEMLPAWVNNNIDFNWVERLLGRVRYQLWKTPEGDA